MVDDQASLKIQNINRQFTAMGNQVGALQQRMTTFNSAINTNSRNFVASANAIKTQGNALANNTANLTANSTQFTTLGGKVKATASQFAGFATGLAVTTSGALQLAAGFRDYNDAQIAVERVQRKLSLATEAQNKAQDKLKALTDKGITSGKAYAQAQLDVEQANAAVSIQTQLLGEAQERMFDSQSQFVASVIPTTLGALGTLGSAFKDLGGTKGLGGLTEKFKSFGGAGGIGGLIDKFKGLGTSASGTIPNISKLGSAFSGVSKSGTGVTGILTSLGGALSGFNKSGTSTSGVLTTLGKNVVTTGGGFKGFIDKIKGLGGLLTGAGGGFTGLGGAIGGLGGKLGGLKGAFTSTINSLSGIATGGPAAGVGMKTFAAGVDTAGLSLKGMVGLLGQAAALLAGFAIGGQIKQQSKDLVSTQQAFHDATISTLRALGLQEPQLKKISDSLSGVNEALGQGKLEYHGVTKAIIETVKPSQDLVNAQEALNNAEKDPALKSHVTKTREAAEATLEHARAEVKRLEAVEKSAPSILTLGKNIKVVADNTIKAITPTEEWIAGLVRTKIQTVQTLIDLREYAKAHGVTIPTAIQNDVKAMQDYIANALHLNTTVTNSTKVVNGLREAFMATTTAHMEGLTGSLLEGFLAKHKGANVGGAMTQLFVIDPKPISAGLDVIGQRYHAFLAKTAKEVSTFTGETQRAFQKATGVKATDNLTGMTKAFALDPKPISASKDEIGKLAAKVKEFGTAAVYTDAQAVALNKTFKDQQDVTSATTATYVGLVNQLKASYDTRGKNIDQLEGFAAQQESINKQIEGFQQDQEVGYKEVEASILGVAFAHNVNTDAMKDMVRNGEDEVAQLRTMVAESINYTAALDDMKTNQELISEGFLNGITSAEEFFNDLVKGTEQEGVFNAALADGSKVLGIRSNLLAFSSAKMQQLIKDTYEQSKAYDREALSASKSTAFLQDQRLIMGQVNKGMIDGAKSANDWAISNIRATAEGFAFHDQLVKITADMLGLPVPINASDEALKKAQTTFQQTFDAGLALAEMMTDKLAPSFERVSSLIQSKDMKELRDNLKKMELPKGFNKDLDDAFKPLRGAAEEARQLGNAMDILVTAGANMSKKDLAGNMKAFGNELDRIAKIKGTSKPVDAILMSLKTMSPEELGQHTDSIQFLVDTINKFGSLPKDKAKEFIDMYNKETPKMGPSSTTATTGVDNLTASLQDFNAVWKGTSTRRDLFQGGGLNFGEDEGGGGGDKPPAKATLDISEATKNITRLIGNFDGWVQFANKSNPIAKLTISTATKAITQLIGNFDGWFQLAKGANPAAKLDITLATKAITRLIGNFNGWISRVEKANPKVKIDITGAVKSIDRLIGDLNGIPNITRTVTIKTQGGTISAQKGLHAYLLEDTLIQAHKGEHVDIGHGSEGKGGGVTFNNMGGGGTGGSGGGDTIINVHVMDETIMRRITARSGKNRFTMGV